MRHLLGNHFVQASAIILAVTFMLFGPMLRGQLPLPGQALSGLMTGQPERRPAYSIFRDSLVQGYPYHVFAARALQGGTFPLWNDLAFAGTPFFANGQSGVLAPTKLLWWWLPLWLSFSLSVMAQFLAAGAGMYVLGKSLGWSKPAALTAAISAILVAPFVLWSTMTTISGVIAWLPWALWSFRRLHATLQWRWMAWSAAFVAAIWLSGHAQVAFFSFVVVVIWAAGWWQRVQWRRRLVGVGLALVLGVGLAAGQLVPFTEATAQAYREPGSVSWSRILRPKTLFATHNKDWAALATLINPTMLGREAGYRGPANFIESNFFVGLLPLLLAGWGLTTWRRRETKILTAVGVVSLLLIMFPGFWSVAGKLLPSLTVAPVWRLSFIATFSLAFLAGVGVDRIVSRRSSRYWLVWPGLVAAIGLWQWQYILPFTPRQALYQRPPILTAAQTGDRLWPRDGGLDEFMVYNVPAVLAYDSVYPKSYLELWQANAQVVKRNQLVARDPNDQVLTATGTNLVLTSRALPSGWRELASDGPWRLAQRTSPVPLAHTVTTLRPEQSSACVAGINLLTEATVIGDPPIVDPAASTSVEDVLRTPTRLAWRVTSSGPTALVTAFQFYPGWRLTIDGQPADAAMLRVNHSFLGAAVPAGIHRIEFHYQPWSLSLGLGLSLVSLIVLVASRWLIKKRE